MRKARSGENAASAKAGRRRLAACLVAAAAATAAGAAESTNAGDWTGFRGADGKRPATP